MVSLTDFFTKVYGKSARVGKAIAYSFAFMLVLPLWLVSCGDKDDPEPVYEALKLSTQKLELKTENSATFTVVAGSGDYKVKTYNNKVAEVSIAKKVVTVVAKGVGETKVSVFDNKTQKREKVTVVVTQNIPDLKIKSDVTALNVGDTAEIKILAGSGKYKVEANEFVEATLEKTKVVVRAVKKGKAKVVITDTESKQKQEVTIDVTEKLVATASTDTVNVGETMTITIASGSGKYKVTVNEFVKAELKDAVVTVTGVKEGAGKITIVDEETKQKAEFTVNVTIKLPDLTVEEKEGVLIKVGETTTYKILTGSGEYSVEGNENVEASLEGNVITVKGILEGLGIIVVTDNKTEQQQKIELSVAPKVQTSITMVTELAKGSDLKFKVDADVEYRPAVWIDLNGNNKKDKGEGITEFGKYLKYKVDAQTITVYGNVKYFSCFDASLTSIDISKTPLLETLWCYSNKLQTLDVSKNPKLKVLGCNNNQLKGLDLSKNVELETLVCSENELENLDIVKCVNLKRVTATKNKLTSLDVSNNKVLEKLTIAKNELTALDLTDLANLKAVNCAENKLTSLKVNGCKGLKDIYCIQNELTELDVKDNVALEELSCYKNKLTALDVTANSKLKYLAVHTNQIKGAAMDALVASLHKYESSSFVSYGRFRVVNYKEEDRTNKCTKVQAAEARKKGWEVEDSEGNEYKGEE